MKFRTELPLYPKSVKIKHNNRIFLIGSCFSSSIGQKLSQNKFNCLINPFGTLYHPYPILQNLRELIQESPPKIEDFVLLDERFVDFDLHSALSAKNREELSLKISDTRKTAREAIAQASFVFITYGSSFSYYHKKLEKIVANCHKQPAEHFDRRLSSVDQLKINIQETAEILKALNPEIKIILTLSPVRHTRYGLIENNRSKSNLLSAMHTSIDGISDLYYFPSYELVMDDLRDYRFFKEDLIHPNDQAINYIWSYLSQTYFDADTMHLNKKINSITSFLQHRPSDEASNQYGDKLAELIPKIEKLENVHSLNFDQERILINQKMAIINT